MGCCQYFTFIIVLVAIIIASGVIPFGSMLDNSQRGRGLIPATHEGIPWGFSVEDIPNLQGHVLVVTGANSGLGYWSSYHLANAGATVVVACRSASKCDTAVSELAQATGSTDLHAMVLDLGSFASIRSFANACKQRFPAIDSLVLNAGIMRPPFGKTVDGIEQQIGVNHFGHFLLTQELLPALERAAEARGTATVSVVSSSAHYMAYPEGILSSIEAMNDPELYEPGQAYGQSKLANVLFAQELAKRVADKGILVNSAHPGVVDTNLVIYVEQDLLPILGETVVGWLRSVVNKLAWHPREGALTQLYIAVSPEVKQGKITGKYYHPVARMHEPDAHAFNSSLQARLWAMTEEFVNRDS